MSRRGKGERGVIMVLAGIFLAAIFAIGAIAIELSHLSDTATEVQVAADAAALAAAENMFQGGNTANATTVGQAVAGLNSTDGRAPNPTFEFGTYASATGFSPGGGSNAVRATIALQNVQYVLASVLGLGTSTTVTKRAVATYGCTGSTQPDAPLTVCDCLLQQSTPGQPCVTGPSIVLTQTPDGSQNSCFLANPSTAQQWFPPECFSSGGQAPVVSVGDALPLKNGQMVPDMTDFQSCLANGVSNFTIPIIHCPVVTGGGCPIGHCNGTGTVVGFATIDVTAVSATGGGSITFHQVCNNDAAGTGGSAGQGGAQCFGQGSAQLVDDRAGT